MVQKSLKKVIAKQAAKEGAHKIPVVKGPIEGVLSAGKGQEEVSGAQQFVREERTF